MYVLIPCAVKTQHESASSVVCIERNDRGNIRGKGWALFVFRSMFESRVLGTL